jgi:hypothetical protein
VSCSIRCKLNDLFSMAAIGAYNVGNGDALSHSWAPSKKGLSIAVAFLNLPIAYWTCGW